MNDITLLESWVISAQGHFTKNIDLFPRKISKSLNGCPMKAFVKNGQCYFTTTFVKYTYSNGTDAIYITDFEYDLVMVVLEQMNMSFKHIISQEDSQMVRISARNLINALVRKEIDIIFGGLEKFNFLETQFDYTNTYNMLSVRWYVPCSVKYPR